MTSAGVSLPHRDREERCAAARLQNDVGVQAKIEAARLQMVGLLSEVCFTTLPIIFSTLDVSGGRMASF